MKENITESVSVQSAEAQETKGTAETPLLGKFKSVDALLDAYNSLEAEFTRRSQRLRELEGRSANGESGAGQKPAAAVLPTDAGESVHSADGGPKDVAAAVPDELREKIIAQYLSKVRNEAPNVLAGGGSYVGAPKARAKTLEGAARQAAELFKKSVQGE